MTWTAYVSGSQTGVGNYSYSWNGTDYSGNVSSNSLYMYYPTYGYKTMNVTVWYNGQNIGTVNCGSVNVIDP